VIGRGERWRLVESFPAEIVPDFLDVGGWEGEGGEHGVLKGLGGKRVSREEQ